MDPQAGARSEASSNEAPDDVDEDVPAPVAPASHRYVPTSLAPPLPTSVAADVVGLGSGTAEQFATSKESDFVAQFRERAASALPAF
eukprot:9342785-Alexandrium_andersonii.AAC.1